MGLTSASKAKFAEKGSSKVPISNIDDKRQITGIFCVSMSGDSLPIHMIYKGLTDRCHPKNHWSNEAVHLEYLWKNNFI